MSIQSLRDVPLYQSDIYILSGSIFRLLALSNYHKSIIQRKNIPAFFHILLFNFFQCNQKVKHKKSEIRFDQENPDLLISKDRFWLFLRQNWEIEMYQVMDLNSESTNFPLSADQHFTYWKIFSFFLSFVHYANASKPGIHLTFLFNSSLEPVSKNLQHIFLFLA